MCTCTAAYRAGKAHYANVGWREAPLSGEWAGESIPELSREWGINLEDDENADQFEDGFTADMSEEELGAGVFETSS